MASSLKAFIIVLIPGSLLSLFFVLFFQCPIELIKTKQQLRNDEELFEFAQEKVKGKLERNKEEPPDSKRQSVVVKSHTEDGEVAAEGTTTKLGTFDLIVSMVELRGPLALFQSADITFLASLVFGSFGFGATELFRRSFTEFFFPDPSSSGGSGGSEIVLLLAAALATVGTT